MPVSDSSMTVRQCIAVGLSYYCRTYVILLSDRAVGLSYRGSVSTCLGSAYGGAAFVLSCTRSAAETLALPRTWSRGYARIPKQNMNTSYLLVKQKSNRASFGQMRPAAIFDVSCAFYLPVYLDCLDCLDPRRARTPGLSLVGQVSRTLPNCMWRRVCTHAETTTGM